MSYVNKFQILSRKYYKYIYILYDRIVYDNDNKIKARELEEINDYMITEW